MKGKINKKSIMILIIVGVLALSALGSWFILKNKQQPVVDGSIQEEETDLDTAPIIVLDYNNVSLGLNNSFTVQAKTYFKGEEVKDKIEYTWELDEDCSADIASMEAASDSATITGLAYGETAFKVSAEYRGTLLVKKLSVYVGNLDVIFDSPNMQLSAGCYTVNLGLLETDPDGTSMTPEIYVYDEEELVANPAFTWTNSDETIATRDASGKITAKKAGTTLIVGTYKESELHIRVNVHRSKVEKEPVCIEAVKNYALSFSDLKGMEVQDVRFNGVDALKSFNKSSGTIQFDSDKLPKIGTVGELLIQTDKAEYVMEAIVVTMGIHNEADLNKMASVIKENNGAGYYALANDIKCSGVYDSGLDVEFVGTFDGRGNTIYNFTTSDRDGSNRGLLGSKMGATGVVQNVSFINAKHSGNGGLIVTDAAGSIKNVYIQVDLEYSEAKVTSVLATYTFGVFSTENVLIEYMNPLPTGATSGYAVGQLYHGYAKHQGLYVIGANKVAGQIEDLGGGLKDEFAAYMSYGDFLNASVDVSTWENNFWSVQNGIPYPVKLGTRVGTTPNVSIPEYISPGTTITIQGATIYDRISMSSSLTRLGIKVSGNLLIVPESVPAGTVITLRVSSVFDASKKTTITTKVLETERVTLPGIYNAERYKQATFDIDFGSYASKVEGAQLFYVAADGKPFARMLYKNGILTLDNESPEGLGRKTVEATFKKGDKLIAFTIAIDVCTKAIYDEVDLKGMAAIITELNGAGRYVLGDDIVCTGTYDSNIDVAFTGSFDGHGFAIYNMKTSDRDAGNRGLLGASLADTGVVENVSFVNAKHSGNGGLIVTDAAGSMKNVYIQVELEYSEAKVTSVLATYTFGVFSTENVLIEYVNPLPTDATSGYAVGQLYHGYAKHQGLYVIGASKIAGYIEDLGGGLKDVFAAYMSYGDYLNAGVDASKWENDFWSVQNGIPYPVKMGTRVATTPNVSIPEYISPGTTVTIQGTTICDRISISSALTRLGIKVSGNLLIVPESVPAGTEITLRVSSAFDASKKTTVTTKVLKTEKVTLPGIYNAERYKQATFGIDFGSYASKVEGAQLFHVAADGKPFARMYYKNGILTLDTESPEGLGRKKLEVTFKKGDKLIAFTTTIDVCTQAIYDETDLKDMAAIITENNGAGRYILGDDIVCTETYDSNISVAFTGSFDGHGYTIYNMTTSDRDAGNRGLLGASLADTAVVENVSFVNAKHGGKGGFIAMNAAGTIRNVYIQIDITGYNSFGYDDATSILASSTFGVFTTENVLIEYINPLPVNATNGYPVWQLWYGYAKHQGLYAVGANAVATSEEDLGGGLTDVYGAYMSYADLADAKLGLDSWKNDFWGIYNGIPYPKHLGSRAGEAPKVSIPKYVGAGASVVIDGLTMHDRVVLNSEMKALGITVKDGALHIPASVPRGTNVRITVESVFDSSKKTVLQATVYETVNVTLENTYDVETYNRTTFDIDFGTQASAVEGGTLISATLGNTNFAKATYQEGVLTLDTSTLADFGEKVITVVFDKDSRLVTVTINIDVSTMVIRSEEDLNNMASVITENNGDGRYVLGQDITCQGTYDSNWTYGFAFNGSFDGRGYAIYNMTTSDRDAGYRSLIGFLGSSGVIENVSFVNAKHGGQGGFITTNGQGTIRNVYVQIDITDYTGFGWDGATSVLASSTAGSFATENVLIEYINPLPSDATNGYAIWEQYYSYAKHQGLYVVGASKVNEHESDLGGELTDVYAAYRNYGDFILAENDLTTWANDFWTITNGIPYPTNLGVREGEMPQASIPAVVAPGSEVAIAGATMYDRVILAADAKELGITVSNNVILVPETVPAGTTINLVVQSVFDETKKVNLSTEILTSKNVSMEDVTIAEINNNTTFQVDLTQLAAEIGEATLVSAAVDGKAFVDASYENGILTLDTVSISGYGAKTVSVSLKGADSLVSVSVPIDVCTMAIDSEEDLNNMTSVIVAKSGKGRYILTSDIICEGTYDSNSSLAFNGVFDGCGYAIYNMTTSSRDGGYRSLIGLLGGDGVIENVSFVNAKHGGQGGFITTNGQGTIRNVYVQIDVTDYSSFGWDGATSVLASSTAGGFSTQNVLVEYINPLPSDATTGYAIWEQYYGYAKHQGLYVVGAERVSEHESNLGAGLTDVYAAYGNYDDFLAAGNDLTAWTNDFWTVTNGIPYPTHLGVREAVIPEVSIPEQVAPGSEVAIEGVGVCSRVILAEDAKALGITISKNVLSIPATVPEGTTVNLTVQSIFDETKQVNISTEIRAAETELTPISWKDFIKYGTTPLANGETFSTETEAEYSGKTLNNTAFEGDVVLPSGSGFRYAVPSTWYGLTIQESSGNLTIGGDVYTSLNGVKGVAYTLKAADYGLSSFTDTRFTIRIELYNLDSDKLNASLNIYVNGKEVGSEIPLKGSTVAATTYLGKKVGFANNGLKGGITIYDKRPELTEITWSDFTLTDGQTFNTEREAAYTGETLNNTVFEGDVVIPSGSGFRYAVPSTWYGLTIQENSGDLQIGGDSYTSLNGVKGVAYTLKAGDYELTSFTDTRFTIRIELYNLSSDNLNATLNIYVNGKAVGYEIPLVGSTVATTTYLGNKVGFANNGLQGGITIYNTMPELTEITWSDFMLTDGQTFDTEREAAYTGGLLNNTAFEGDVVLPSGSGFRYAVPSTWYGLTIQENSGDLQIGGDSYTSLNGVKGVAYTLKAGDYGLTSFTDTRFTIRIELYNLSSDNLNATLNIYVNGKAVGYEIPLVGSTVAATTYLGNKVGFANNGLNGGITIYNKMSTLATLTYTTRTNDAMLKYSGINRKPYLKILYSAGGMGHSL